MNLHVPQRQRGLLEDPLGDLGRRLSHTAYRTLVSYKETWGNAKIDPHPEWTGTWRDPRFAPPGRTAARPENALTGTLYMVNSDDLRDARCSAAEGKMRLWRNTSLAPLAAGPDRDPGPAHRRLRVRRGPRQRLPAGRADPAVHHHRADARSTCTDFGNNVAPGTDHAPPDDVPGARAAPWSSAPAPSSGRGAWTPSTTRPYDPRAGRLADAAGAGQPASPTWASSRPP